VLVTAVGTSTHASMPRPDNAIFALSRAMAKISDYETPVQLTPSTRQFFATLGKTSGPAMAKHFQDLLSNDPARIRAGDLEISKDPLLHAIMRNTIAPVIVNGGFRGNVIPGSAEANLNVRMIPGTDPNQIVADLQRIVNDPQVTVHLSSPAGRREARESSDTTLLFRELARAAREVFPGVEVTPYLFQAGTDAGAWRAKDIPVYGIYPYPITADELTRMHGNDERVPLESLHFGVRLIHGAIARIAGARVE
jgi:acetylornithine deacetylase/succinyl-diaminopimelate desuccinylase-like protein